MDSQDKSGLSLEERRAKKKKKTEEIQQRKLLEQLGRQEIEAEYEAEINQPHYLVYFLDANAQIVSQKYINIPEDARQAVHGLELALDKMNAGYALMIFYRRVESLVQEKKLSLIDKISLHLEKDGRFIPSFIVQGTEKEIAALDYFLKSYQTKNE